MSFELESGEVFLDDLSSSGEAVGRLPNGKVVFVPFGAPSERVLFRTKEEKKGFIRGDLVSILQKGASRVEPACMLAAQFLCGGCSLMHIDRASQIKAKENFVQRALRHHDAAIIHPLLTPAKELEYRIRARFVARFGKLGFQAPRLHKVTSIDHCAVLIPKLNEVVSGIAQDLCSMIGEEGTFSFVIGIDSQIHVAIDPGFSADIDAMLEKCADYVAKGLIAGAYVDGTSIGKETVNVGEEDSPLWVSADTFSQACFEGHTVLPDLVLKALKPCLESDGKIQSVLELHAGSGNFTRKLTRIARKITVVESDPKAVARLRQMLFQSGVVSGVSDVIAVRAMVRTRQRFSCVVLDPPRTGAKELMVELPKLSAQRIVYVSCDPMTLARDVSILTKYGYVLREVTPVDLMPQTPHVEMVAVLDKEI